MNFTGISDCELLVMKCLWDLSGPSTVHTLISELDIRYEKRYKETTVYTFLANLKKKSFVNSYKRGTSYFYPLITEEMYVREYAQVMRTFFGEKIYNILICAPVVQEVDIKNHNNLVERIANRGLL